MKANKKLQLVINFARKRHTAIIKIHSYDLFPSNNVHYNSNSNNLTTASLIQLR